MFEYFLKLRIPYDVGGQHTCLSRRIPGFESRYGNHLYFSTIYCFVLFVHFWCTFCTFQVQASTYSLPKTRGETRTSYLYCFTHRHPYLSYSSSSLETLNSYCTLSYASLILTPLKLGSRRLVRSDIIYSNSFSHFHTKNKIPLHLFVINTF